MTPFDLVVWALAVALSIVLIGLAVGLVLAVVKSTGSTATKEKSN